MFLFVCDDRRELLEVADKEQLYATKGLGVVAETSQYRVDGVEHIAPHHRDLVDDEQVERADDLPLLLAEVEAALDMSVGHERGEGQLEERMDRDSTRIDGSHTRRRHYHQSLAALLFEGPKKGSLSRTRLSCEEDTVPRVLYKLPGCPELVIFLHFADSLVRVLRYSDIRSRCPVGFLRPEAR